MLRYSAVGSPETVRRWLESFVELTKVDEVMVTAMIYDHAARLRSFEIVAGVRDALNAESVSASELVWLALSRGTC